MTILLIIHVFIAVTMIGVILLQRSEGGGLAGMGGSSGGAAFTARGAANLLTRVTGVLATIFFANCLLMGILARHQTASEGSLLAAPSQEAPVAAPAAAPVAPVAPAAQAPVSQTPTKKD